MHGLVEATDLGRTSSVTARATGAGLVRLLGMALEPYDGWGFRLVIEHRVRDGRSDAEVIELRGPGTGPDDA